MFNFPEQMSKDNMIAVFKHLKILSHIRREKLFSTTLLSGNKENQQGKKK